MSKYLFASLALASAANAVSLGDVKHVVLVMMENRSFQHVSVFSRLTFTVDINKGSYSDDCSTSVPCLVFEGLPIRMCRSISTVNLSGISKCGVHLGAFIWDMLDYLYCIFLTRRPGMSPALQTRLNGFFLTGWTTSAGRKITIRANVSVPVLTIGFLPSRPWMVA